MSGSHCTLLNSATLAANYRRLMMVGTLVFLVLVGWTVWSGWQRQYAKEVSLASQRVGESAIHLQSIIKAATDHLAQMTHWATRFPEQAPYSGAHTLQAAVQAGMRASTNGEFTLDALAALPEDQRLGQMLALTRAAAPAEGGGPNALDLGVSLLGRMGDAHKTSPFLRWSYFFSADRDQLAVTPWADSVLMLDGETRIERYLQRSWTYDITKDSLPERNPQRQPFWTAAYPDQAAAGLMVSHGAPIYWGDTFVGVVGTDVLLAFLDDFLRTFPDPQGTLLIINEHGQILGDRRFSATENTEIRRVADEFPDIGPLQQEAGRASGVSMGTDRLFIASIDNPQWQVVFLLPKQVIAERVLKAYAAPLVLTALLVLAGIVMNWLLWRMYVAPALQIAGYVARESASSGELTDVPALTGHWQPWIQALAQAFADRRHYLMELEASKQVLEERVAERTRDLLMANQELEKLTVTDALTGASNRRHLFQLLEQERQRIDRGGPGMAVLLLDLDHFKRINDNFGHAAGDAVLCEFVRRCSNILRATDTVCRYGGEEFAILLPGLANKGAHTLAERLRGVIAEAPFEFGQQSIAVTVSIGATAYAPPETVEDMLARADRLLYRAKNTGRNQVVWGEASEA